MRKFLGALLARWTAKEWEEKPAVVISGLVSFLSSCGGLSRIRDINKNAFY